MGTASELVEQMATNAGVTLKFGEAEHILWSETGFPCFWPDRSKTPEENLRVQLKEYFDSRKE